jgi:hypothetical protein
MMRHEKDRFNINVKTAQSILHRYSGLIIRITVLVMFFILPFVKLVPLSIVPQSEITMTVTPPGYPINGASWSIQVWGSNDSGVTWIEVDNATINVSTSNKGTFQLFSDAEGKASFMYVGGMGTVSFSVFDGRYGTYDWIPQSSFVPNNLSLFVIGVFGVGTPSIIWEVLSKNRKKNFIEKVLYYPLLISLVSGWALSFYWFANWRFGTEWGFGNTIVPMGNYSIDFSHHLWTILLIVIALIFLNSVAILFSCKSPKLRKTQNREPRKCSMKSSKARKKCLWSTRYYQLVRRRHDPTVFTNRNDGLGD